METSPPPQPTPTPTTNNNSPPNEAKHKKRTQVSTHLEDILTFLLHQWLLIGMGIVCVLAYYFPNVAKHGGTIRSEYSILYGAMALIFLISGLSIPHKKLLLHLRNWRLHILVQATSFLFIPALVLAIVHIILATDTNHHIDRAILAGYVFTACIPTTIASNVVMTRAAGGDDAAALVEVLLANLLGPFITAAWTIALLPQTADFDPWRNNAGATGGDLATMYRDVFKQLGLGVLVPLAVGQIILWSWPERTALIVGRYKLAKVGTFCMLLLVWATFSSCFATGALQALSGSSVVFVVFFNVALYVFLTGVSFVLCWPPGWILSASGIRLRGGSYGEGRGEGENEEERGEKGVWNRIFHRISAEETIAVCFCAPAKSTSIGIPLLYAMWTPLDLFLKAKTSVPVLLYTTEQICVAHVFVQFFRRWAARVEKEKGDLEGGGRDNEGEGVLVR